MKKCIKLEVRIDLEDGNAKVNLDSEYAPIDTQFMKVLQATIRTIARVFYAQVISSKTTVSWLRDE